MKHFSKITFAIGFLAMVALLTGCFSDDCDREITYIKPVPIYQSIDEIRVPVKVEEARIMDNPGKIYYYNDFIFINEIREGVHVIDNRDPRSPQKVAFINVPGNIDMAVKGNVMYVDNYIDLLALDISNPTNASLITRVENAFLDEEQETLDGKFLVGQRGEQVTEKVDCDLITDMDAFMARPDVILVVEDSSNPSVAGAVSSSDMTRALNGGGISGSMARFVTNKDVLYTIDNNSMHVFDISNASTPAPGNVVNIAQGIETIYPYNDHLFIGGNNGMYIYSNADPANPTFISEFQHVTACDPVVVEGDYAYVTIHDGTECWGWLNELHVVDISDITNPTLVHNRNMSNPHGLSVLNNTLYVCDGRAGLKVLDVQDPTNPIEIEEITDRSTYDVIAIPDSPLLLVVGEDGFFQYDRSDPSDIKLLSGITK